VLSVNKNVNPKLNSLIMKKFCFFVVAIVAISLLFSSCEKEEDDSEFWSAASIGDFKRDENAY
jgi:hypothetical protein